MPVMPSSTLPGTDPAATAVDLRRTAGDERAIAGGRPRFRPQDLARNLAHGAMLELRLTPKPGLVDLRDSGAHPDLSFVLMARSASMLPAYYQELQAALRRGGDLAACIAAGRRAEERMLSAVGSNAHRGYIFLSGLILLAACRPGNGPLTGAEEIGDLRLRITALAEEFFLSERSRPGPGGPDSPAPTHGARVRRLHNLGGVRAEALSGLPSLFETGWPSFTRFFAATGDFSRASYYMMARLMQNLEDTTTVHRCGLEGLRRIRRDGALLERVLEEGDDHIRVLERLNEEYIGCKLTLGGVADCMGLAYAAYLTFEGVSKREAGEFQARLLRDRHGRADSPPPS
jgi:triphosphoribosyl-dephospho-CoA synthetase